MFGKSGPPHKCGLGVGRGGLKLFRDQRSLSVARAYFRQHALTIHSQRTLDNEIWVGDVAAAEDKGGAVTYGHNRKLCVRPILRASVAEIDGKSGVLHRAVVSPIHSSSIEDYSRKKFGVPTIVQTRFRRRSETKVSNHRGSQRSLVRFRRGAFRRSVHRRVSRRCHMQLPAGTGLRTAWWF